MEGCDAASMRFLRFQELLAIRKDLIMKRISHTYKIIGLRPWMNMQGIQNDSIACHAHM